MRKQSPIDSLQLKTGPVCAAKKLNLELLRFVLSTASAQQKVKGSGLLYSMTGA